MRIPIVLAAAGLLISTVAQATDQTTTFNVVGWTSEGAVQKTVSFIRQLRGVKVTSGDLVTAQLKVTYDDEKVKQSEIEQAILEFHLKVAK